MSRRLPTAAAAACLALLLGGVWWLVHPPAWLGGTPWWYGLLGAVWVVFGVSIWLVRKVPVRTAVVLIVIGGVGMPLAAGFAPPRSSDDMYRYVWDGRVQLDGINPYRYPPDAPELAHLRDDFLWPETSAWCVPSGCSLINRPNVNTIYPPAAQAFFAAVEALSPDGAREWPIQLASMLFAAAVTVLLLVMLPRSGIDPRRAVMWAWCPLVALEAGNNAHLDVVGAFLTAAALFVAARAKTWRGTAAGAGLLGLAAATKITPLLTGPALMRRRPVTVVAAAVGTVALVYLPHLFAVGPAVIGYLPAYINAEGYQSGTRFGLLNLVLQPSAAAVVAVAILLITALLVYWRSDPDRPWDTAVVLTGVFLLVATPGYSWYALLLVVLVAMSGRAEWLAVAAAGYIAQYSGDTVGYQVAALIIVAVGVVAVLKARMWSPRGVPGSAGVSLDHPER